MFKKLNVEPGDLERICEICDSTFGGDWEEYAKYLKTSVEKEQCDIELPLIESCKIFEDTNNTNLGLMVNYAIGDPGILR